MTAARSLRLARVLWILAIVFGLSAAVLSVWGVSSPSSGSLALTLAISPTAIAIATVGYLVASRRSNNAIGWIYLGSGLWLSTAMLILAYGEYATVTTQGGFGGTTAVWFTNWWWVPVVSVMWTFPFLLFPDGRLLTRRWRPVAWAAGAISVLWTLGVAFAGSEYSDLSGNLVPNPYSPQALTGFFDGLQGVGALFLAVLVCSVASLVLRFRRSGARVRAQIKWLILAGVASGAYWIEALATTWTTSDSFFLSIVLALMPLAVGVAILRYRLYDIDRIISRTTSYAVVTAVLVLVYLAVVTAVSQLLPSSSSNALAVAAATLAAAALFRPVLTRVQGAVDRRFNRSRYDAQRTLDAFAVRLRDSSDPDRVVEDLLAVVDRIVEPSGSGLWIRH